MYWYKVKFPVLEVQVYMNNSNHGTHSQLTITTHSLQVLVAPNSGQVNKQFFFIYIHVLHALLKNQTFVLFPFISQARLLFPCLTIPPGCQVKKTNPLMIIFVVESHSSL